MQQFTRQLAAGCWHTSGELVLLRRCQNRDVLRAIKKQMWWVFRERIINFTQNPPCQSLSIFRQPYESICSATRWFRKFLLVCLSFARCLLSAWTGWFIVKMWFIFLLCFPPSSRPSKHQLSNSISGFKDRRDMKGNLRLSRSVLDFTQRGLSRCHDAI